jgi:hypothetical protein
MGITELEPRQQSSEDFAEFFLLRCYISMKNCSNVSGEVSGNITSPEKNCCDASIIKKNALPARFSSEIHSILLQTVFCYNEVKMGGFFCFTEAILEF